MLQHSLSLFPSVHLELTKLRIFTHAEARPYTELESYARGWDVKDLYGESIVSHDGSVNGFGGLMIFFSGRRWGVVALGNTTESHRVHDKICRALVDELLSIPLEQRFDWDANAQKEID